MAVERLIGVFGAGRQMAAMEADQRRKGVAVEFHQAAAREARGVEEVHSAAFTLGAPRLASIWLIASTTASNVSSVEAWRAL